MEVLIVCSRTALATFQDVCSLVFFYLVKNQFVLLKVINIELMNCCCCCNKIWIQAGLELAV